MRILGHFFVYLRPHDNMFTGLGGFRGVILAFSAGDLSRLTEDAECIRTDAIRYENTFLSDYKLPFALHR